MKDKPNRWMYALTILNLLAHQLFGVDGAQVFVGLDLLGITLKLGKSLVWTLVIACKTAFFTAFGHPLLAWAEKHMWFLLLYWASVLLAATGIVFSKCRQCRPLILAVMYLVCAITFLNVLSRGYNVAGGIDDAPRYVYIQSLSFLVLFVVLVDAIIRSRVQSAQPGSNARQLHVPPVAPQGSWTVV